MLYCIYNGEYALLPFNVSLHIHFVYILVLLLADKNQMCKIFMYLVPDYITFIEIAKKLNEGFDTLSPSKKKFGVGYILY